MFQFENAYYDVKIKSFHYKFWSKILIIHLDLSKYMLIFVFISIFFFNAWYDASSYSYIIYS